MSGAFDGIEPMFSQIELFLKTYPGDENIKLASIALIAVTFHVVECVIGFFVKSTCTPPVLLPRYSSDSVPSQSRGLSRLHSTSRNINKRLHKAWRQSKP